MESMKLLSRVFWMSSGHRLLLAGCAVVLCVAGAARGQSGFDLTNLQPDLEAVRQAYKLPALGAALVTDEGLKHLATTGVRKKGATEPVKDQDLWHLGSCGKAMTATMIARLVEQEKLRFEQTVGETFPRFAKDMSADMQSITLIQLLSHTSGLPANVNLVDYQSERSVRRARRKALLEATRTDLLSKPGTQVSYSNWGYIIAGHMAEIATGKSWEALMRAEVFRPLKMSTAGFGGTGTLGKIDQPWPHSAAGQAMPTNGKAMDNLPVMGPAGTIHMSLEDWGKFITEHLKGHRGKSTYLKRATFKKLHTAIKADYAVGWMSLLRPWANGKALHHGGDNTLNCAVVWAAPERGFAVLAVTNQSSAHAAVDAVATGLILAWGDR